MVVSAVEGAEVVFRLGDAAHAFTGVRLWQELGLAAELLEFKPVDYGWELRLPRTTSGIWSGQPHFARLIRLPSATASRTEANSTCNSCATTSAAV